MSRQIDWTKRLSRDDRAWAINRNMHEQVAANDEEFGREPHRTSTERGTAEPAPANQDDALQEVQNEPSQEYDDSYDAMTVDQLKAELDDRREAEGNSEEDLARLAYNNSDRKKDLIRRLREDDAVHPDPDDSEEG